MANFMLLFWMKEGEWKPQSPEEMQRLAKAWSDWLDDLKASDHLVKTGERLNFTGKVIRSGGNTVTDGPYAEAKDMVVGYMVVKANDIDEAVTVAKGCPNLAFEGLVEVRPVLHL